jgi:ankyrin repeat protein
MALIEAGVAVDQKNKKKETPLQFALKKNQAEVVGILLEAGASTKKYFEHKRSWINFSDEDCEHIKLLLS